MRTRITAAVVDLQQRVRSYEFAMLGALASALDAHDVFSQRNRDALSANLTRISESATATEARELKLAMQEIGYQAWLYAWDQLKVEAPDQPTALMEEFIERSMNALIVNVNNQIKRESSLVRSHFIAVLMEADMMMQARKMNHVIAISLAKKNQAPRFRLGYRDSLGRTWQTERYFQLAGQQAFYTLTNEMAMYLWSQWGIAVAWVDNPGHAMDRQGFTFAGPALVDGTPTLADIRAKVFHPNSTALVSL